MRSQDQRAVDHYNAKFSHLDRMADDMFSGIGMPRMQFGCIIDAILCFASRTRRFRKHGQHDARLSPELRCC